MGANLTWKGATGLVPQWSGADLQLADRVTDTDVYRGPIGMCRYQTLLRGTYGSGARLGWVVTSSKAASERKGIGTLTINWEVGGPYANPMYLPLDDFRSEPVELYPKVERNKRLFGPTYPANPGDRISAYTIALCYQAVHGVYPSNTQARGQLANMGEFDPDSDFLPEGSNWIDQWGFGGTLLSWLDHGNETYYQAGTKYSHIWHSFTWPELSNGGVVEPFPSGGPRMGDASLSWLRLADTPEPAGVNGSVYKVTSTWLGGPNGHWDAVLYS
jgi:hypothetical protein